MLDREISRRIITLCRKLAACLIICLSLVLFGCASRPDTQQSSDINVTGNELDVLETCRRNLSIASPDTLRAALSLLEESEAGKSEAGIEYAYIASQLMFHVYPVVVGDRQVPEAPAGSVFPELFKKVEAGETPDIKPEDISFLTVLSAPVTVLYSDRDSVEISALELINQAISMNDRSVLPLYLRGFISERNGRYDDALNDYSRALDLDPSTYPAEIGTARIYTKTGRSDAAVAVMDMLAAQYPFSDEILLTAAEARFLINDYNGALDYSSELLRINPDNPEVLILRARIFLQQENLQQARRLIEVLERSDYKSVMFYLVKSGVEKAGGDNLSALNTLEEARAKYPDEKEIEEAYGAVLMLTGRKDEAREILTGEGSSENTGSEGLIVLIDDAIDIEDWNAASDYAQKLSATDKSLKAGIAVWKAWYAQGDYRKAETAAADLYERYPDSSDSAIIYIRTLTVMNRRLQAERLLDQRIPVEKDSEKRSVLYFLKSLTDLSEEEKLQSLRSALFENLQNIEALVAISDLYLEMGDIRKAYQYIKQAAALEPDNTEIRRKLADIEEMLK